MNGSTVLVTGGGGLIGAHVTRRLLTEGRAVVVLDRTADLPNLDDVAGRIRVEAGDVFDECTVRAVVESHEVTHIVHLAGVFVSAPALAPIDLVRTNVVGTAAVFEAARAARVARVVWSSTVNADEFDAAYDGSPVDESHRVSPRTLYGASKYVCEVMAADYVRAYGMDIVGVRPPMVYGSGRDSKALHAAVRDAARGRDAVLPYTAASRSQPIHVRDMARLLTTALSAPSASPITYNTPVFETVTGLQLADLIERLCPGTRVRLGDRADHAGIAPVMDGSRATRELGFVPEISLEEGLREMIALYRADHSAQ